jgi:hypothetical protein
MTYGRMGCLADRRSTVATTSRMSIRVPGPRKGMYARMPFEGNVVRERGRSEYEDVRVYIHCV